MSGRDFFGCYLLHSRCIPNSTRTYIGFTVNPARRIRQHNGLLSAGAWKTKSYRPWEMALVLYGFPTQVQALQFEWAWQHPYKSKAVRTTAASLGRALGRSGQQGVKGKIRLLLAMLHLSPWKFYPLTLQFLSPNYASLMSGSGPIGTGSIGMEAPPPHIKVLVAPIEDLPKCIHDDEEEEGRATGEELGGEISEDEGSESRGSVSSRSSVGTSSGSNEGSESKTKARVKRQPKASISCSLCDEEVVLKQEMRCSCGCSYHMDCLAGVWIAMAHEERVSLAPSTSNSASLTEAVPSEGLCPSCQKKLSWISLLQAMTSEGWGKKRGRRGRAKGSVGSIGSEVEPGRGRAKAKGTRVPEALPPQDEGPPKVKRGRPRKALDNKPSTPKPKLAPLLIEINSSPPSSPSPSPLDLGPLRFKPRGGKGSVPKVPSSSPSPTPPSPDILPLAQRLQGRTKQPPISIDLCDDLNGLVLAIDILDASRTDGGAKRERSMKKPSSSSNDQKTLVDPLEPECGSQEAIKKKRISRTRSRDRDVIAIDLAGSN